MKSSSTSHVVTAPLVVVKGEGGGDVYLYEGDDVPADTDTTHVARLAAAGLLARKQVPRSTSDDAQG